MHCVATPRSFASTDFTCVRVWPAQSYVSPNARSAAVATLALFSEPLHFGFRFEVVSHDERAKTIGLRCHVALRPLACIPNRTGGIEIHKLEALFDALGKRRAGRSTAAP